MPIRPENKKKYPPDWPSISARIKRRAGYKCEQCGVAHGELGGRLASGTWCKARPTGDNGLRLTWPAEGEYFWCDVPGGRGDSATAWLRVIRIVLTVAHLDHQPEHCDDANLRAWCQACHNRYDAHHRRAGIAARAKAQRALGDLFEDVASPPAP